MKKIITYIALFVLMLFPTGVFATETNDVIANLDALKESIKNENKVGEFDIKIKVPGKENITSGANVLFVMDGSYSTDEEWLEMRSYIINTAKSLLSDTKSTTRVGLMSFGVAPHLNIPLTRDASLFESTLPLNGGGTLLLPGRSATNIEGGLRGAYEYLSTLGSIAKSKEHTYVIFLTDGEANFNETKFNWYEICLENSKYLNPTRNYLLDLMSYADNVKTIERANFVDEMIKYVKTEYAKRVESEIDITDEYLDTLSIIDISSELSNDKLNEILDHCVEMLYTNMGYDITNQAGYSISELENMFSVVKYIDDANYVFNFNTYVFYNILSYAKEYTLRNATRAIDQGILLSEYATIYTIGYNIHRADALKIMNPEYQGGTWNKIYFPANTKEEHFSSGFYTASVNNLDNILNNISNEIIYSGYKDAMIVDYTSKWVNPIDTNGDGIFDEKDIVVTNDGVVVDNAIVTVEKLSKEDIKNSTDPEIIGNTNGDIYKITCFIEDYLRSWDKYELSYKVKVDTQEKSFVSGTEYKANGLTTLTYDKVKTYYTDGDTGSIFNEEIIEEDVVYNIEVPTVSQIENVVIITKTDEEGTLLEGADFNITSNQGVNQIVKKYSVDGINWTDTNEDGKATYFKFSGLYDFKYTINETTTPDGYLTIEEIEYNFDNIEDKMVEAVIANRKKDLVPQTYNDVNYRKGISLSLIGLTGIGTTGLISHKKKKRISKLKCNL